jgi:hypothetical protein
MLTTVQPATTSTLRRSILVLVAGLRRLLNRWVAAVIRETALLAQHQLDDREPKNSATTDVRSLTPLKSNGAPRAAPP